VLLSLFAASVAGGPVPSTSRAAPVAAFRVVVNAGHATGTADRRFVTDAFLKKTTRWPDGSLIRPVDLGPASPVRERFSEEVLGRSVAAVKSYWQQLVFSGRGLPPPELDGDAEVVSYVATHAGAIGYVSPTANIEQVRMLTLR
jgi:ABC-type phosphate transport system substrate-binding protein